MLKKIALLIKFLNRNNDVVSEMKKSATKLPVRQKRRKEDNQRCCCGIGSNSTTATAMVAETIEKKKKQLQLMLDCNTHILYSVYSTRPLVTNAIQLTLSVNALDLPFAFAFSQRVRVRSCSRSHSRIFPPHPTQKHHT